MQFIGGGNGEYAAQPNQGGFNALSLVEQAYWGATHRAIIKWTDIVAAATATALAANTGITLGLVAISAGTVATAVNQPTGTGQLIECVFARLVMPFANAADAAQNTTAFTVGDVESATQFLASMETNLNGAFVAAKVGAASNTKLYTAADTLEAAVSAPGAGKNLVNLTQGELHVFFRKRDNTLPG